MITSRHNPRIQVLRQLLSQAKHRQAERAFVVEGVRLAEEALQAGWQAREVFFTEQLERRGRAVVEGFIALGVPAEQVTEAVMNSVSETETPQGLLVVLERRELTIPPSLDFVLVLDGVRDPGNLGTILRTSAAAGVQAVLLAPGNADAFAPKVVRAGMGAHFRLPIVQLGWDAIRRQMKSEAGSLKVYLADVCAGIPHTQADFRAALALIVGGEAAGAGSEAEQLAEEKVHIRMPGGSESLNAGVATGILLFEVLRQRSV